MSQTVRAMRLGLEDLRLRIKHPLGAFVRLCLAAGCPLRSIVQGTGVDVSRMVGRRVVRRRAAMCTRAEGERVMVWLDWVVVVDAYARGEASMGELVEVAGRARGAGCDLSAWGPGGIT